LFFGSEATYSFDHKKRALHFVRDRQSFPIRRARIGEQPAAVGCEVEPGRKTGSGEAPSSSFAQPGRSSAYKTVGIWGAAATARRRESIS